MTLFERLDRGARFDAEYRAALSNHLPMALVALHRLGASEQRLDAFAERYAQRLADAPPADAWPADRPWRDGLGEREAWPALRHRFDQLIARDGGNAVLREALPVLMPGCAAAAFHGLIRTAYAVISGHRGELAAGLAYWACRWQPLVAKTAAGEAVDPVSLLQQVGQALRSWSSDKGLISDRMAEAASQPAFATIVARLRADAATLPTLAEHAMSSYVASGNFTVLHLVTSAHALRVLMPYVADVHAAVREYWVAYAAGCVAASVAAQPAPAPSELSWHDIAAAAIACDDEHVVKLAFSCREEFALTRDDDYRLAAARAVTA